MRATYSLILREFTAYFLSPIAYVTMAVFLLVTGYLFYLTLGLMTRPGTAGVEYPLQAMFGDDRFWLIFLFIPALLTMRLLAEERGSGSLELLMTAPIKDWQVVAGKFLAAFLFYIVLWLPTLIYLPVLLNSEEGQPVDPRSILTTYTGILFTGAMFLAIGLFISSLVKSQIVAAQITMSVSLIFIVTAFWQPAIEPSSLAARMLRYISVPDHFRQDFTRGVIDTRNLVLYFSLAFFSLFLTVRSLEARRLG